MSKLEAFEGEIEARGGEEAFFDRLASTEDLAEIAREYGASLRTVYVWRKASEARLEAWNEALRVSGDAFASESRRLLRELHEQTRLPRAERLESAKVALVTARATNSMKIAAARNPQSWGERPQVQVNTQINLGSLHLEALKAKGSMNGLGSFKTDVNRLKPGEDGEEPEAPLAIST